MTHFKLVHLELKEANEFVERLHRHHAGVRGHRFSLGADLEGALCGVAIVGRPVSRLVDRLTTLEVTRLCSDGTANVCSFLYSASARAGRALGYSRIQTYTLEYELGVSLIAAGWSCEGLVNGRQWKHTDGIERRSDAPTCDKFRWSRAL